MREAARLRGGAAASAASAAAPAAAPVAPAATTATTATTAAPAVSAPAATDPCRNSADPTCGPFRFDPQPAGDRPMTLSVSTVPATPKAGEEVVFRVVLNDPDGVDYNASSVDYGDQRGLAASQVRRCERYGPWDPPAPDPDSAVEVVEFRHVFEAPGSFTTRFSFDPGPFDCTDAGTGGGDRPYASPAGGHLIVVVAP